MTGKISLRGVAVVRGSRRTLEVPQLDVAEHEILAVVGPNGAGKSTLLQVLGLLERPTAGDILFNASPIKGELLPYRRRMAVVFQDALLLDISVESNVRSGLALRGIPVSEQKRRSAEWLERFGIASLATRSSRYLSGGEAQRVSLARALVLEPEVLLLDEPFAALDAPTRETLIDDLDRILRARRTTTIFVTHDRSEALRLGDRVAVLIDGVIRQIGEPSTVFGAPADEEVAAFLGVETIVPARLVCLRDGLATLEVSGVTLHAAAPAGDPGEDVLACLRPEDVVIGALPEESRTTSARNHLPASITRILPAGPHIRVELDAGFPLVALITKQAREDLDLSTGSRVEASFKAMAVHLIPHRRG
jgi:tungstate transport system ATP-binding protein